ncbi:MAG: PorV/PorQ family protein [Candidatus Margulisiibacteriota bacterium]
MKKAVSLFILILFVANPVASDIEVLLDNGVGARAIGMGKAQVADAKGTDSVYWNPAKLAKTEKMELSSSVADIYGVTYRTFAFMSPALGGQLGLMLLNASQGAIPEATLDSLGRPVPTGGLFAYDASAWLLSYGRSIGKMLVGTTVKYLKENLANNSASGFGVDVGVALDPSENLSLGAKLENVVKPQTKWDTSSGSVDQSSTGIRVGASLKPNPGKFKINGDVNIKGNKLAEFFLGGEYRLAEALALRGGVFNGAPTFGLGLNYRGFNLDYSYAKGNEYLEDSHRVNLSIAFDHPAQLFAKEKNESPSSETMAKVEENLSVPLTLVSENSSRTLPKDKKISFSAFGSAYPGRTLYFKVATPGIKAERVSVIFANEKIELYRQGQVFWKGDLTLKPTAKVGRQYLDVYVADVDGHLYKQRARFEVLPLPEVRFVEKKLDSGVCALEVLVPGNIKRASMVIGEEKIPFNISQGRALIVLSPDKAEAKKRLYLADNEGRLFSYEIERLPELKIAQEPRDKVKEKEKSNFFNFGLIFFAGFLAMVGIGVTFALKNGKSHWKDLEKFDQDSSEIVL